MFSQLHEPIDACAWCTPMDLLGNFGIGCDLIDELVIEVGWVGIAVCTSMAQWYA